MPCVRGCLLSSCWFCRLQIRGNLRGQADAILPEAVKTLTKMFGKAHNTCPEDPVSESTLLSFYRVSCSGKIDRRCAESFRPFIGKPLLPGGHSAFRCCPAADEQAPAFTLLVCFCHTDAISIPLHCRWALPVQLHTISQAMGPQIQPQSSAMQQNS